MYEVSLRFLGGEDLLEEDMATNSSILAWGILWTDHTLVSLDRDSTGATE